MRKEETHHFFLFLKDLRERERARVGRAEKERERDSSRLHDEHGVRCVAGSHDPKTTARVEMKSQRPKQQ